jgi:ribosomal-protein-alanine N-acetyltransferase
VSADDRLQLDRLTADNAKDAAIVHGKCFTPGWSAQDFRYYAKEAGYHGLVARLDGRTAGLAVIRIAGGEAEILTIATDPAERRNGIARRLLTAILEALSGGGVTALFLEVGVTNQAALALYKSLGFVEVGRRAAYYQHTDGREDALTMQRLFV